MANNLPSIIADIKTLKDAITENGLEQDTLQDAILSLDRLRQSEFAEESLIRSGNSEVSSLNTNSMSRRSSSANTNMSDASSVVQTTSNISEAPSPYRATILEPLKPGDKTRLAIGAQNSARRLAETAAASQKGGRRNRKTCRCRYKHRHSHKRQSRRT